MTGSCCIAAVAATMQYITRSIGDHTVATVYPYISENAQTGQKASLKIHQFVWLPVGQGEVRQVSDYAIDIAGEVNIVVYKGDLRIYLQLLDQDPTAASGPCRLQLNSHVDENATYRTENGVMTVSAAMAGKEATVSLSRHHEHNMTRCAMTGFLDLTAYVAPE